MESRSLRGRGRGSQLPLSPSSLFWYLFLGRRGEGFLGSISHRSEKRGDSLFFPLRPIPKSLLLVSPPKRRRGEPRGGTVSILSFPLVNCRRRRRIRTTKRRSIRRPQNILSKHLHLDWVHLPICHQLSGLWFHRLPQKRNICRFGKALWERGEGDGCFCFGIIDCLMQECQISALKGNMIAMWNSEFFAPFLDDLENLYRRGY